MVLPERSVTTNEWTRAERIVKGRNELPVKFDFGLTPYVEGIQDTCDLPGVRVIAVEGNGRSGKTIAAENQALKRIQYGPFGDMYWYMQSQSDLDDYMEERGEWNLEVHEAISAKIDHTFRRQSRTRKKIGESQYRWLAASRSTLRGKAAAFIVADEIDAYPARILKGLLTLLRNRQREFGSAALLYLCSHPDAGTKMGIDKIIQDGLRHLWHWSCLHCGGASSPSPQAAQRMSWNLPDLIAESEGAERTDVLDYVEERVRLICPHCSAPYDNLERQILSRESGAWLQPGQQLVKPRQVDGERIIRQVMGFCIHAHMAPFITTGEAARELVAAKFDYDDSGDDTTLKTAVAFTLGEPYESPDEDTKIEDWAIVERRMKGGGAYLMRQVPVGCHFLTAFVDVQGDRFVVMVIGWSQGRESWLIDYFELKQWPAGSGVAAFQNLDPFHKLSDWSILEEAVLRQTYPLQARPNFHLPIARMAIDTGGSQGFKVDASKKSGAARRVPGDDESTTMARLWTSHAISRKADPIPEWRLLLLKGSAYWTGELYGTPKQVLKDDRGKALPAPVLERTPVVNKIKKIIAKRMKIGVPGPGMMHAPQDAKQRHFRELTAEKLIGLDWLRTGRNELWDGWVGCETTRASLQPERIQANGRMIDFDTRPPLWARPFRPGVERGIDTSTQKRVSSYSRMLEVNAGADEADPYGPLQRPN